MQKPPLASQAIRIKTYSICFFQDPFRASGDSSGSESNPNEPIAEPELREAEPIAPSANEQPITELEGRRGERPDGSVSSVAETASALTGESDQANRIITDLILFFQDPFRASDDSSGLVFNRDEPEQA